MPRTTEDKVMDIIEVQAGDDLDMVITSASSYVDSVFAPAAKYSDTHLMVLETWLTAHLYAILRSQLSKWETDGARDTYDPIKVDLGLSVTKYGQQVVAFDYLGLIPKARKVPVGINWLGKTITVNLIP
jgi:hypothetical protein